MFPFFFFLWMEHVNQLRKQNNSQRKRLQVPISKTPNNTIRVVVDIV